VIKARSVIYGVLRPGQHRIAGLGLRSEQATIGELSRPMAVEPGALTTLTPKVSNRPTGPMGTLIDRLRPEYARPTDHPEVAVGLDANVPLRPEELDRLVDEGKEDVLQYFDLDNLRRGDTKRINLDMPVGFLARWIGKWPARGVTRQSLGSRRKSAEVGHGTAPNVVRLSTGTGQCATRCRSEP
jgi:hypothetical protein